MTMDELRDIKPIVPLSWTMPWWAWAAAACVALLVLAVVWWRRRKSRPLPAPVRSPADAAKLALEAVRGMAPRDRIAAERLQSHVAAVLRYWLTYARGLHATDLTTEELRADARLTHALGDDGREVMLELLAFADTVRFAGQEAEATVHTRCVERAYLLVTRGGA